MGILKKPNFQNHFRFIIIKEYIQKTMRVLSLYLMKHNGEEADPQMIAKIDDLGFISFWQRPFFR